MAMDKTITHIWSSLYNPGNSVYLKENGGLLRTGALKGSNAKYFTGGAGGIVESIEWNGEVSWSFKYANDDVLLHHDIEELPNGHILMIAWETLSKENAILKGRNPDLMTDDEIWPDHIIEVDPESSQIVWEWHLIDHLIQDYDALKSNYGVIEEHPELIDINYIGNKANGGSPDWTHINSIDYNDDLDQILLSVHGFSEIWIIDHSTTPDEALGHIGGTQGSGGDILFRWGNPQAYGSGNTSDQIFFGQHDARWIVTDDNSNRILVFNNGSGREIKSESYSSIDEIVIETDDDGNYKMFDGQFLPEKLVWTYISEIPTDFFSQNISGADRLKNGNTLVCSGSSGKFFEIDVDGKIVWEYTNENSPVFRVTRYQLDLNEFN